MKAATLESKFPLLAVENGCIVSKEADVTVAFRVELPELFSVTGSEYEAVHSAWHKAVKVLPEYSIVHKQDFFIEEKYRPETDRDDLSFLSRSFERHFNERPFLNHFCYLFLTKTTKARSRQESTFSTLCKGRLVPKEIEDRETVTRFLEAVGQFEKIMNDSGFVTLRRLKGVRKMLICEEAWKALSSPSMSEYLKYLYKTVRKYFGEAIVVTQEVDDIISSPIVKEAIITNSDCKILLDQKKYMNKFDGIQSMLGLTDKEKSQILSINLANHPGRKYKEVWIGLNGVQSAVYATEVSAAEYLTYTTEESEKTEVFALAEELGGDLELAIKRLAETKYK